MRIMHYGLVLLMLVLNQAIALTETTVKKASSLQFQIVQAELIIDSTNIRKASMVKTNDGSVAIKIELKNNAADELKQLTYENMGKKVNIVFNDRVVSAATLQSTLGNKIIITGFTRQEAQLFLKTLNFVDKAKTKNKRPPSLMDKINEDQPALIQIGTIHNP